MFKADEWKPGDKAVYVKNPAYKPRAEPTSGLAGGKVALVDRIEMIWIPDAQTQVNALKQGEIDMIESVPHDLLPAIEKDANIRLIKSTGSLQYTFRPNWKIKPFDNPKIRQAAMIALDQHDFLAAAIGDPRFYATCKALFTCKTPLASEAGMDGMLTGNSAKAAALLKEAGYDGTPVVILRPSDLAVLANLAPVAKDQLERAGFKVDVQSMDWQTVLGRVPKTGLPSEGGWNAFLTAWAQVDILNPIMMPYLAANCDKARPGWPCDADMEKLRDDYARAMTPQDRNETRRGGAGVEHQDRHPDPARGILERDRRRQERRLWRTDLHGDGLLGGRQALEAARYAGVALPSKKANGRNMSATAAVNNIADVVRAQAKNRGNALAFEFEGRLTTFAEFNVKTNRVANALIALGLKKGDRIAYLGKNSDFYFELLMGAMKAGVVMAPVNWRLAGPEVAFIVGDCKAAVLFAGPEFITQVKNLKARSAHGEACHHHRRRRAGMAGFCGLARRAERRRSRR